MRITHEKVSAAYKIAKDNYTGRISPENAANYLVKEHGWIEDSAYGYIHTFIYMMNNKGYLRTFNAYATEYYLRNIYLDFGWPAFENAISSVKEHLQNRKSKGKSSQSKIEKIIEKLEQEFTEIDMQRFQNEFDAKVAESLFLSKWNRDLRLNSAPKKPNIISIAARVYSRNPDVVAAVLIRANGICEKCLKPAPFKRAKDQSPYLEVHHKIQLVRGGDDTINNAIALCPNFHRELHCGL